jgi:hypothetical protein
MPRLRQRTKTPVTDFSQAVFGNRSVREGRDNVPAFLLINEH